VGQHCTRSDWCLVEERSAVVMTDVIGELVSRMRLLGYGVGRQPVEVDTAACWLEVYVRLEEQNSSAALQNLLSDDATDKRQMCLP